MVMSKITIKTLEEVLKFFKFYIKNLCFSIKTKLRDLSLIASRPSFNPYINPPPCVLSLDLVMVIDN